MSTTENELVAKKGAIHDHSEQAMQSAYAECREVWERQMLTFTGNYPVFLAHYTTAAGLKGILEKRVLFATHYQYLNDSLELVYGIRLIQQALKRSPFNMDFQPPE